MKSNFYSKPASNFIAKACLLVFLLASVMGVVNVNAQCTNSSAYGSAVAPTTSTVTTISTCSYQSEYTTVTGLVAGNRYIYTYSIAGTFITVRQGTSSGQVVAFGQSPLTFTAPVAGTYYFHSNTNSACGVASSCGTTTIGCVTCGAAGGGCTNSSSYGSATAPTSVSPGPVTISTCSYQSEYTTISGVAATTTYKYTYSLGGWITVHQGSSSGPIVASGGTPLIWTSTVAGTYYVSSNTTSACGTASSCGTTTIQYIGAFTTTCSGTPNAGTISAASTTVCPSVSFTITSSGLSSGTGISYQWQSASTCSGPFSNIVGQTGQNLTTSTTVNTAYRVVTTCSASGLTNTSNCLAFTVASACINMTNGSSAPICSGKFFDSGGPDANACGSSGLTGNYLNSESYTYTINPSAGNNSRLTFNYFCSESGYDYITIYDGPSTASPVLFGPSSGSLTIGTITATNGPLTIRFTSDGSVNYRGWDADISCVANPNCSGTPSGGSASSSINPANVGQNFVLSLTGASTGLGIGYQWQSSPNNSTWTNITGATSASLTTNESVSTYYRCIATCSFSSLSAPSTSVLVTCTGNIVMTNGSATLCSGSFYDSGGPLGAYQNSETYTYTLTPSTVGGLMQLTFNSYISESGFDYITIYNGVGTGGTILYGPSSGTLAIGTITANSTGNPTGSLTVRFTSDGSVAYDGWNATVSCLTPCSSAPVPGNTLASPGAVCCGASFNLSLQFPNSGPGIAYQWQSSPDNSTWTNITGATSSTYTGSQSAAMYYRCAVTCTPASATGFSNSVQVTMSTNCAPSGSGSVLIVSSDASISPTNLQSMILAAGASSVNFFDAYTGTPTLAQMMSYSEVVVFSNNAFIDPTTLGNNLADYQDAGGVVVLTTFGLQSGYSVAGRWSTGGYSPVNFGTGTTFLTSSLGTFNGADPLMTGVSTFSAYYRSTGSLAPGGSLVASFADGNIAIARKGTAAVIMAYLGNNPANFSGDWGRVIMNAAGLISCPCSGTPSPGNTLSSANPVCASSNFTLTVQSAAGNGLAYQWQSSPDNSTWTNIPGATSAARVQTQTVATYYRCAVTCTNSGLTGYSNSLQVTMNGTCGCTTYCTPPVTALPCTYDWIGNVTLNTLNNTSGCAANSYTLFPATGSATTTLTAGTPYTFSITDIGYGGYNSVWIDLNQNGVFDASERLVIDLCAGCPSGFGNFTSSATLTVPISGTLAGTTRMRVRYDYFYNAYNGTGQSDPCGQLYEGETEDYCITIALPAPCSGTPVAGSATSTASSTCSASSFTLNLSGSETTAGLTYQWQSSSDNSTWTNITGATSVPFSTSATADTYFRCVVTCSNSGIGASSSSVLVSVVPCINMTNGSTTTCSANFYDSGGPSGTYQSNENYTYTFNPTAGNLIRITWGSVITESGYDYITIYDGPNTSSPILYGPTSGTQTIPVFTSSDASGALTVRFTSDGSVTYDGWNAVVSCVPAPVCTGTPTPGNTVGSSNVCSTASFTLSLQNATPGAGVTYQWQSSPDNSTWANGSLGTSATQNISNQPAGTVYYRCVVTCASSGQSGASTGLAVTSTSAPSTGTIAGPAAACTNTAFSLSQTVAGGGSIQWQENGVDIPGATSATLSRNLTASGIYTYHIRYNAAGCPDALSNDVTISVTTGPTASASASPTSVCPGDQVILTGSGSLPSAGTYCSTSSTYGCSGYGDEITNVTFANINRTSGCDLYVYTPSPVAPVTAGVTMPISISTGVGNITNEGVAVWIDLNQDGTFSSGELLYSAYTGNDPETYNGTITVPTSAYNGTTRMRIECMYAQIPTDPCNNTGYGEFEDYNVTISGGTPNPSSNVTYSWTSTPAGFTASTANATANPMVNTTYTLSVSGGGCTTTANTTQVTMNSAPVTVTASSTSVCNNGSSITLSSNYDSGPYPGSVSFSGPVGSISGHMFNPAAVSPGTYTITCNYNPPVGCSGSGTINITVYALPVPNASNTTLASPKCEGLSVALSASPSGSLSPYSMTWSGPGFNSGCLSSIPSNAGSPVIFSGSLGQSLPCISGTYTVTVTDGHGCINTGTTVLTVHANPTVMVTSTAAACEGTAVTFQSNIDWHGETPAALTWYNPLGDVLGSGPAYTISSVSIDDAADLMDLYGYPGYDLSASNAAGCSNDYGFTLHVISAPVFDPQSDISVSNDLHNCSAVVNYSVNAVSNEYWYSANGYGFGDEYSTPVTPVDYSYSFSSPTGGSGTGTGSGSTFNVGTTTVTITADNHCTSAAQSQERSVNPTALSFNVTVTDDEAPVITTQAISRIVECDGNGNLDDFNDWLITNWGDADATDNCTSQEQLDNYWVNDYAESHWVNTCGNGRYVDVTFRVYDRAGNYSLPTTARFTIQDTQRPVITQTCGATSDLGCNPSASTINAALGTATAMDICDGSLTPGYVDVLTNTSYCGRMVTRTWNVSDACDNAALPVSCSVSYIEDTSTPEFQLFVPTESNLDCNPSVSDIYFSLGYAVISSNGVIPPGCIHTTPVTQIDDDSVSTDGGCHWSLTRHWHTLNTCSGNAADTSFTVYWTRDYTAPVIAALPAASDIQCPASPVFATATAVDACSGLTSLTYVDSRTNHCGGTYSVTRTWTAVDHCGNSSQASQTINVVDHTAPVIAALPSTSVIECPASPVFAVATATDACSAFTLTSSDATSALCGSSYSITRTWTATDACGNSSTASQTIRVEDHTAPVITVNPAISLGCNPSVAQVAAAFGSASATDACSAYTLTSAQGSEVNTGTGCGNTRVTKTWTAVDACGNTSSTSQTITFTRDLTPPVIAGCPSNITLSTCTPSVATWTAPTASDNCGSPTVVHSGPNSPFNPGVGTTTTETYTFTDGCGNTSSCNFTITRRGALTLNVGVDEATYYGYSADQAFTHTLTGVSGGTLPYNYSWTFTRMTGSPLTPMPASTGALRCNNINSTGDEIFNVIGTPLTYANAYWTCSGVSTANYIAPAYPLVSGPNATSVNLMLLDTAKVICTITDADGCQATDDFLVYAEDARCWAGNSTIQKVTICHRSNNSCATICVDESAVSAHLAHGDVLGACRNSTSCLTAKPADGGGLDATSYLTAYPNPFSNSTTIAFSVPKDGRAVIKVFDAVGNEVGVLFDGMAKAGEMNKVEFDGSKYAEGMYFYSISSDDMNQTKKMQLIK